MQQFLLLSVKQQIGKIPKSAKNPNLAAFWGTSKPLPKIPKKNQNTYYDVIQLSNTRACENFNFHFFTPPYWAYCCLLGEPDV